MVYNFDEILNRRGTDSVKWDGMKEQFGREDLISMWVADMDFRTPPCVIKAIQERLEAGVLGYTLPSDQWYNAIIRWVDTQHQWGVKAEEIIHMPGIVRGLAFALQCFTEVHDRVMVMPPVYHPFFLVTEKNHREVVYSPLHLNDDDEVVIDFEQFERDIEGCKVLILCNPQNPSGRVWTRTELTRMADICQKHQVLVFSDEIHCDLTLPPYKHIPFASVNEWTSHHTLTFMAPSKTFNMPGISSSFCIVQDDALRERFHTFLEASELEMGNVFSYSATAAAFSGGSEWLYQLKAYLQENIDFTAQFLEQNLPELRMIRPQASYLIYLDCRKLQLPQDELVHLFVDEARLALNDGTMFGKEGKGFMRLNVGCPKAVLCQALEQLKAAIRKKI